VRLARYDHVRGDLLRDARGFCVPCDADEPGELLGRIGHGGGIMEYDGYTDREATERKIARNVFEPGDAWFRSGDLLKRDADGYYYFVDRVGDTFRWKGENVATQEVADAVNGAPGVSESTVYGVEVPGEDGRAGMAAVVLAPGAAFDGAGLYAEMARHLPPYARPAFVRLAATIEVTGTLKQRKIALACEGYDPASVADPLYVRHDGDRAYVPLTTEHLEEIRAGRRRL
jgi:fatty-acyl-CoA synthase